MKNNTVQVEKKKFETVSNDILFNASFRLSILIVFLPSIFWYFFENDCIPILILVIPEAFNFSKISIILYYKVINCQ